MDNVFKRIPEEIRVIKLQNLIELRSRKVLDLENFYRIT